MNTTTTTAPADHLFVTFGERAGQYCDHHGAHPQVALVTGSIGGWYIERHACRSIARHYTDQVVVNNSGQPVPVTVR